MKITKQQLDQIIQEEAQSIQEYDLNRPRSDRGFADAPSHMGSFQSFAREQMQYQTQLIQKAAQLSGSAEADAKVPAKFGNIEDPEAFRASMSSHMEYQTRALQLLVRDLRGKQA